MSIAVVSSISDIDAAQIENQTNLLCSDIKRTFHRRKNNAHVEGKKLLIARTRQWIESCKKDAKAVGDALASILVTLDDVDAIKLQYNISAHAHKKRGKKVRKEATETPCIPPKRRRRLPHNSCSLLHDTGEFSDDDSLPKMYLSNSDRYKRAKRSFVQRQNSCSMMGISLKAMNASVSKTVKNDGTDTSQGVITTLIHDAAVLRRDVYKHLSEFDTVGIKALIEESKCSLSDIVINDMHQTKIVNLTSTLLQRISLYPESPSMRLSAIITLDSLRQLELSDLGYRCILDVLLDLASNTSLSLNYYAEILSQCHAYEHPMRLLCSITKLMQRALEMQKQNNIEECKDILRAISHIMVCRQSILSSLNQDTKCSPVLRTEIESYRRLCDSMSVSFDSISHWISPTMSRDVKEEVLSALQAEGILSMFCELNGDEQSPQRVEEYPYPACLSLRAAHDRMGPLDGVNRLLSHPVSYEQSIVKTNYFAEDSSILEVDDTEYLFSHASDDIIVNILSFLSYRSLARASQVCTSWRRASNSPVIWAGIYFTKFRNRSPQFEGELAVDIDIAKDSDYLGGKFLKIRNAAERQTFATTSTYNWKHMFMSKYAVEKKHNGKKKTCSIIGCLYVIRNKDHFRSHMKRHESSVRVQSMKRNSYKNLQTKVTKLRQRTIQMEKTCLHITNSASSEQTIELNSPHDVLRQLVFPYLDYKDIIVSSKVCKLWAQLVDSNALWKSLYQHHFGLRSAILLSSTNQTSWKTLFRTKMSATYNVKGKLNDIGWAIRICPIVGCHKDLHDKFTYDYHVLKHDEKYCMERIKYLTRMHRSNQHNDVTGQRT